MEPKILIIDDDEFFTKVLENKLKKENFNVSIKNNGEKITEGMIENRPDVLLLDLILPQKDGFAVLEEIKKSQFKNIPVIIFTVLSQESDIEKAVDLGAVDYLVKTKVSLAGVVERVKKQINNPKTIIS